MPSNNLVNISGATKVALNGYDPVSFFPDASKSVNGDFNITSTHKGATYYFVNQDNKTLFESDPEKYAPQYGGFCAYGVSKGGLFPVDVQCAQVLDGKLYLNLNQDMVDLFEKDKKGAIIKAVANWPGLVEKNGQ